MYCSSCGKQMDQIRMRCPECHHMTSAYWLNAYSLALWLLIVAANYFFLQYLLPVWANTMAGLGKMMPFPVRVYAGLAQLVTGYGPLVIVLAILSLGILHWKKMLPDSLKSGRLLASVTWVVMVLTLGGVLATFANAMGETPQWVMGALHLRQDHNELAAIDSVRTLVAAEAAYKQKHPDLGYTCKLDELKPVAVPLKYETWAHRGDMFTGESAHYQFSLRGCSGKPAAAYQIVATPFGWGRMKRFCADNSGKFNSSDYDNLETCLNKGTPVY